MKKSFLTLLILLLLTPVFSGKSFADTTVNNLIPTMTSNTAPSGVASSSSIWSGSHQPFNAFNKNNNDLGWASKQGEPAGWIAYEFEESQKINHYTLTARGQYMNNTQESPKDWTFEGWDGEKWNVLDTQVEITGWTTGLKKEFTFSNEKSYKKYRLNISKNNGYPSFVTIGEIEMMYSPSKNPEPETPNPDPEKPTQPEEPSQPTPNPEPKGDRAILVVTMTTGLEKEYDLPIIDVNAFLNWYDARDAGVGPAKFAINKYSNNKGPFSKRTDYVIFDKILTFEVSEYTTN